MKAIALLLVSSLSFAVGCDRAQPDAAPDAKVADTQSAADKDDAKKGDAKKGAAKKGDAADPHDAFTDLSPDAVQKLVDDKSIVPVDANGDSTRKKYGVVPGAVLLSGADFKSDELPEDKDAKLVFYCGGKRCVAAPQAAKLAQDAGYKDVNVMREGIRGWVKAGNKVDKPTS